MRSTKLLATGLLVACTALTACTDEDVPIWILQNQVPQEGCVIPGTRTTEFRASGLIDTNATSGYLFTPVVQNYGTSEGAPAGSRLFVVKGADVKLSFQEGLFSEAELADLEMRNLTKFSVRFSGTVEPEGTAAFAFVILPLEILEALAPKLDATQRAFIEARVEIFGDYAGGGIETPPFVYPIEVCNGCMTVDVGACSSLPQDFVALQGGECNQLQDVPIECCSDGAGGLTCPASAPEPSTP